MSCNIFHRVAREPQLMCRAISSCCLILIGQLAASVIAGEPQTLLYLSDAAPVFLRLYIEVDGGDYEAPWNRYIDQLFDDLDQDRDGILRGGEIARVPAARQFARFGFRSIRSQKSPARHMTRQDFDRYVRDIVGEPFEMTQSSTPATAAPTPPAAPLSGDEVLFTSLDVDQDGALSAEEVGVAAALYKRDRDDDGAIGLNELSPAALPFVMRSPASQSVVAAGPFLLLGPSQSPIEIARKILDKYDRDESSAKDRRLDANEIQLPSATFSVLDADGDGYLDFDEIVQMVRRPTTHIKVTVRLGTPSGGQLSEPTTGVPFQGTLRNEPDGKLALVLGKTQIEIDTAKNSRQPTVSYQVQYKRYLSQYDGDKNGYLDKSESQRTPFRDAFELIDRDGNGMIVEEELTAYGKQIATAAVSRISLEVVDQRTKLFSHFDSNGDQRLTSRELTGVWERIREWDDDDDQHVSRAEMFRHWDITISRGSVGAVPAAFYRPTTVQSRVPGAITGPNWFQRMDRNHDNDLTKREFLGPLDDFQRLDKDGDGLLSISEATAVNSAN